MQTKNAVGNLINRYAAVLKKCALLNVFGTLAVATMFTSPFMASEALAATNPAHTTLPAMFATTSNPVLNNYGTLTGSDTSFIGTFFKGAMLGVHSIGSANYLFTNYGDIRINSISTAINSANAAANSVAMLIFGAGNHVLINNGTISLTSTAGVASSNSADVSADSSGAGFVIALGNGNHKLINTNTINITATAGKATALNTYEANANANAVAMSISGEGNHELTNSGTMNLTAIGGTANSNNNDAYTDAEAYGMSADGKGSHTLTNNGTININLRAGSSTSTSTSTSDGAYANAQGYGMYVDNEGSHILTNNRNINVSAIGGTAIASSSVANAESRANGISTTDNGSRRVTNNGTINVTAKGGTATSTTTHAFAYANAEGISVSGIGSHTLTNNGTINVTAIGGTATSPSATGAQAQASANGIAAGNDGSHISNSGIINVTAIGGKSASAGYGFANALGMNLSGLGSTISNTGIINASASVQEAGEIASAYEAFGSQNYSVSTWATTLREWSAHDAVFASFISSTNINFDNSTLILRPGTEAQNFALGKEYTVAKMVVLSDAGVITQQDSGSTKILGNISEVKTEVPFLKATLTNGPTANTATVSLEANINEETTPGATTMQQAVSQVQSQFTNISASLRKNLVKIYTDANLIAQNENIGMAAGSDMEQNKWQIFLTPYMSKVNNTDFDFDGNNSGITGGLTYNVSEMFSVGGHLDFNAASYNADMYNMDVDSSSFAFGLHANYNIMPEWYVRAQVTGSISENDVDYAMNSAVTAQSDYAGKALYAELATGYTFQFGKSHFLTPELGLSYLSAHIDDYDIEWTVPGYNMHYGSSSYNALYASFNLDWRSSWAFDNNQALSILAGAGIRQKLTSDDIESQLSLYGTNFTTKNSEDDTVFLADFGLEYSIHDFSFSLNYGGEYGASQQVHRGYVTFKYVF